MDVNGEAIVIKERAKVEFDCRLACKIKVRFDRQQTLSTKCEMDVNGEAIVMNGEAVITCKRKEKEKKDDII